MNKPVDQLQRISEWTVPVLLSVVVVAGLRRRVPLYESFVRGARSGLALGWRLIPYMVTMLAATELFQRSGALDAFLAPLAPGARWLSVPPEVIPMALIRPLSGSAALAYLAFLLKAHGPDSLVGRMASVMQGSTETTLYIITVYFGAVGIRDTRWTLTAGLLADLAGFLAAAAVSHVLF